MVSQTREQAKVGAQSDSLHGKKPRTELTIDVKSNAARQQREDGIGKIDGYTPDNGLSDDCSEINANRNYPGDRAEPRPTQSPKHRGERKSQ